MCRAVHQARNARIRPGRVSCFYGLIKYAYSAQRMRRVEGDLRSLESVTLLSTIPISSSSFAYSIVLINHLLTSRGTLSSFVIEPHVCCNSATVVAQQFWSLNRNCCLLLVIADTCFERFAHDWRCCLADLAYARLLRFIRFDFHARRRTLAYFGTLN